MSTANNMKLLPDKLTKRMILRNAIILLMNDGKTLRKMRAREVCEKAGIEYTPSAAVTISLLKKSLRGTQDNDS